MKAADLRRASSDITIGVPLADISKLLRPTSTPLALSLQLSSASLLLSGYASAGVLVVSRGLNMPSNLASRKFTTFSALSRVVLPTGVSSCSWLICD